MFQEVKLIDIVGSVFIEGVELQLCGFYLYYSRIICLFNICKSIFEKENYEVLSSFVDKYEFFLSYFIFNNNSDVNND